MKSLKSILLSLPLLAIGGEAFSLNQCGVEWILKQRRSTQTSPYNVKIVKDAREIGPGHWVSDDPKGGNVVLQLGEPTESFERIGSIFELAHAAVRRETIDEWKTQFSPLSFPMAIDVTTNFRIFGAPQNWMASANPEYRQILSPVEIWCRGNSGWRDPDGRDWWNEWNNVRGANFVTEKWVEKMNPPYHIGEFTFRDGDVSNRWFQPSRSFTLPFDPAFCTSHLGATIQIRGFRELIIDEFKVEIYENPDPSTMNPCN